MKLHQKRGHAIPLGAPISATKKQLTARLFVDDTDISVKGGFEQEVHKNLQEAKIAWVGGLRAAGGTLRP